MKKMVEAVFCNVCEKRGQVVVYRDDNIHLCQRCATAVLKRIAVGPLAAAIIGLREEQGLKDEAV